MLHSLAMAGIAIAAIVWAVGQYRRGPRLKWGAWARLAVAVVATIAYVFVGIVALIAVLSPPPPVPPRITVILLFVSMLWLFSGTILLFRSAPKIQDWSTPMVRARRWIDVTVYGLIVVLAGLAIALAD